MASNQNVNKVVYGNTTLIDLTGDDVTAASVLSGKKFHLKSGAAATGTIASQAAQTITPGTSDQTIAAGKYLSGAQTIKGDANLAAGNIKSGVSIFGVNGSYNGPTSYSVPIARIATTPAAINASNKYSINNGSTVKSRCAFVVVPTNATNVSITFSTTGNIIAFLSAVNNITDGGTPDFSSSYGSRILKDNGTFNYAISSGMNIIYILTRDTSGNSHMPTSIVFTLS